MKRCIILILLLSCIGYTALSHTKNQRLRKTTASYAIKVQQGFNMRAWISNQMTMGLQAWDGEQNTPGGFGMEYPAGSGVEHIYGAGPRIGGIIDGERRVTEGYNGTDARKEFLPEARHIYRERMWRTSILESTNPKTGKFYPSMRGYDDDGDGKVDEDDLDGIDNDGDWNPIFDDVGEDGIPDSLEVGCKGSYDPETNPDPAYDNFRPGEVDKCHPNPDGTLPVISSDKRDYYTEKNGLPDHGEPHVDEDYAAISDQDYYCSAIDTFMVGNFPPWVPIVGGHKAMWIKVIQKSYAWDGAYGEGILPFDYIFINMGRKVIRDVYVGFFADMDIGPANLSRYYERNYSAYMETLRTAYIHNPIDRGSTPVGITILNTPKRLEDLKYIYQWTDFTTRPDPGVIDSAIYSWMSGEAFPDQPIAPDQSPDNLSDTRFFFSFGKFDSLKPGDTLKISVALVAGHTVAEGPGNLKENAEKVIRLFKRGYIKPIEPTSPALDVEVLSEYQGKKINGVKLTWHPHKSSLGDTRFGPFDVWDDSNKYVEIKYPDPNHWRRRNPPCGQRFQSKIYNCDANGYLRGGRIFSGFRLYRSEDIGDFPEITSFTLLKEVTLPDTATTLTLTEDDTTFIDSNLVRGKRYWYAVTTYGLPNLLINKIKLPNETIIYDTSFSANIESSIRDNRKRIDLPFAPSLNIGEVLVVPNPYRVDQEYTYETGGWEGLAKNWDENKRKIKFIHLPKGSWTIRIFTMTGDLITTISNTPESGYRKGSRVIAEYADDRGEIDWDLLSESNRALASGVYVFSVESTVGTQIGKFVLIR